MLRVNIRAVPPSPKSQKMDPSVSVFVKLHVPSSPKLISKSGSIGKLFSIEHFETTVFPLLTEIL